MDLADIMHLSFLENSNYFQLKFLNKLFSLANSSKTNKLKGKLEELLPFKPQDISLYEEALTHKIQNIKDDEGNKINNERLEFLGDAIIESVISEFLFKEMPKAKEGELSIMRSKIVNRKHLNELGQNLKITNLLQKHFSATQLGKNINGNLYEALVGAIFLDKEYAGAKKFIYKSMIDPYIDLEKLNKKIGSYKSFMIEWAQKNHVPYRFDSLEDIQGGKKNYFKVIFYLDDKKISYGRSGSKKKAAEIAARRAYYTLNFDQNG